MGNLNKSTNHRDAWNIVTGSIDLRGADAAECGTFATGVSHAHVAIHFRAPPSRPIEYELSKS